MDLGLALEQHFLLALVFSLQTLHKKSASRGAFRPWQTVSLVGSERGLGGLELVLLSLDDLRVLSFSCLHEGQVFLQSRVDRQLLFLQLLSQAFILR